MVIIFFGKIRENYVHPLALNAINLSLDPALDLLVLFIAIDPNIDFIARLQCLPPGLTRRRHFLYVLVRHLKVPLVQ